LEKSRVIYLCITPERQQKTRMMMSALAAGIGRKAKIALGEPPDDGNPFVVWGQEWLTLRTLPEAVRTGRPFWTLDNGYWNPAKGTDRGYYRFCYRSLSPVLLPKTPFLREPTVRLRPWRQDGGHVLLAMPGVQFGMALGIDVKGWCATIVGELYPKTQRLGRELRVRMRDETRRPLADDLRDCWAVVTHSSNVAVDAVVAGIPVFVQPTSAAAPVGRTDLDLANPVTPGRDHWVRALASQQFTIAEMRNGIAWHWMQRIAEYVDGNGRDENRAA
jgi:hypothetical protein